MSENYKALTRKYRPRTFEDIVSQGHVSNTLRNAIKDGRLAHAYLFCGPRGVGKTTMARVLARTINGISEEVDGESITQNLNIIEIDAASNNSVDDVRSLRDTVIIPPSEGRYKVYIIDEVHMLSKQAFNALLKTLEEPPAHVIFIFATTEPHKILPTILSRCQRFDFRRISVDEIISRLRHICTIESITIDDASLHHIARKADGALRDALGLLDQVVAFCGTTIDVEEMSRALNIVSTERLFETVEYVVAHDTAAGMALIDTLLAEGYDIQEFLVELLGHLRNLFMASDNQLRLIEAPDEMRQRYREQATHFSADDLMRMLHITLQAQSMVKEAQQPRIQIEIALLKLITMDRSDSLQTLMQEIASLKQALANGGTANIRATSDQQVADRLPVDPKPAAKQPATAPAQPVDRKSAPAPSRPQASPSDNDELFGSPAIKKPGSSSTQASHLVGNVDLDLQVGSVQIIEGSLAISTKAEMAPTRSKVILEDIREQWTAFADYAREQIPQILYYAVIRSEVVDLKHNELTVQAADAFSHKLLEEHRKAISGLLSTYHESTLSIRTTLKTGEMSTTADDPYTRFKAMARDNPKLRLLVDLFGAELEY
jgi:DNA polymerase-3 subunit gamma/tau